MKSREFERDILPVIQQRVTQMFVTPDLLPPFTPSVNVQLDYGAGALVKDDEDSSSATAEAAVAAAGDHYFETGSFLLPGKTIQEPKVNVTSFHPEPKYYTVALIDVDVPDVENQSFKQELHWLM
jgi:large subunit ribosomal protein L35